jgi:hypothetical protein
MTDLSPSPKNTNTTDGSLPSSAIDPFPRELLEGNQKKFRSSYSNVRVSDDHVFVASSLLPVHGTSLRNAINILNDGAIKAYSKLVAENSPAVSNNLSTLTDVLDIKLGLHQYAFLNLGRVHALDIHPVYFVFKNSLLESSSVVVSLREIVHFGALVSREAEKAALQFRRGATPKSIEQGNQRAAQDFFRQCFDGGVFRGEVFPKFIAKNYPDVSKYWINEAFPGTKLKFERLGPQMVVGGAWEGPQVMVKDGIGLESNPHAIFVPALQGSASVIRRLRNAGIPQERIFTLEEAVGDYLARFPTLKPFKIPFDHALLCRLALRDISLLAEYNDLNQNFGDIMSAYKHRLS